MKSKRVPIVGFRVSPEELERIAQLVEIVRRRNPHMDKSKVLREIIGLDPAMFVTESDRRFLRNGTESPKNGASQIDEEILDSGIRQINEFTQSAYDSMTESALKKEKQG